MTIRSSAAVPLLVASLAVNAAVVLGVGAGPANADACPTYQIVGVPGTNQGLRHNSGASKSDRTASMGEQTAGAVAALRTALEKRYPDATIKESAVAYAATGVDGGNWWDARFSYEKSLYKSSKDEGYDAAYQLLQGQVASCPTTKFYLAGFSQGAHIVGDLAQTISRANVPIPTNRLAGAVLLADPAFSSTDPQAITFHRRAIKIANYHGALGNRGRYGSNVEVVSVCVDVDPICVDSIDNAAFNRNDHNTAYVESVTVDGGDKTTVAAWAGAKIASK